MKNTLTAAILIASFAFAAQVSAATTASLVPAQANVTVGQTFNVTVTVNPNGKANFASKIELTYPAAMLEVVSFTQGNAWTALNQPGYDVLDVAKGSLTKTAGYANGFTSATVFGTVTFRAKTSGTAAIKIGSGSTAFEEDSQNAITGAGSNVTIAAAPAKPAVTSIKQTTTTTTTVVAATSTNTNGTTTSTDTAAAASASPLNITLGVLLAIALIVIIGLITMVVRKGKGSVK